MQNKPKASERNEIINIRAEIKGIENRKTIDKKQRNKKTNFQVNKSDKSLTRRKSREKAQSPISGVKQDIPTDLPAIKKKW